MRYSGDAYFDEKNLMDIQVMSTLGLTDEDIEVLKQVDGIENVEAGYSTDALCAGTESQAVLHIMSMLPSMNELTLEEEDFPKNRMNARWMRICWQKTDFWRVTGIR